MDAPGPRGQLAISVAGKIRTAILSHMHPGDRLDSSGAMASTYRCSLKTVRSALAILQTEGLVKSVRGSGSFVADSFRTRQTRTTGMLFWADPTMLLSVRYFRDAMNGLLDATKDTGQELHLMLARRASPSSLRMSMIDDMGLQRFDSIVCMEVFNNDLLEELGKRVPTVSIDFTCYRPGVSSCIVDHAQTIELAMQHLWMLGHRRIGLASPRYRQSTDPAHKQRYEAFVTSLTSRNAKLNEDWLFPVPTINETILQMERLVKMPPDYRPTALIVVDALWQSAELLVRMGQRIPEDISLISIGSPMQWVEYASSRPEWSVGKALGDQPTDPMDPRLATLRGMVYSSVALPFEEMGRWSMLELLRRLRQPHAEPICRAFQGIACPGTTLAAPTR